MSLATSKLFCINCAWHWMTHGGWYVIKLKQTQLQLVLPLSSCSTTIWQDPSICLPLGFLLLSLFGLLEWQNPLEDRFFYLLINMKSYLVICLYLKIPENFMGFILASAFIICQHSQILVSFMISSGSPFLPCHAYSFIPFLPICFICLSWDSSLSPHNVHLLFFCVL